MEQTAALMVKHSETVQRNFKIHVDHNFIQFSVIVQRFYTQNSWQYKLETIAKQWANILNDVAQSFNFLEQIVFHL